VDVVTDVAVFGKDVGHVQLVWECVGGEEVNATHRVVEMARDLVAVVVRRDASGAVEFVNGAAGGRRHGGREGEEEVVGAHGSCGRKK
jgi:hypothetical protein